MNSKTAGIILTLMLASCASAPDDTKYYLLSGTTENSAAECDLSVGRITIPAYLRTSAIIVQTGESELTPAISHRWSEPLADGIRRVLSRCLTGRSNERVNIDIRHLHGNTNGRTHLEARWAYHPSGIAGGFSEVEEQSGAGYEPLVASHRKLLAGLCREVCANRPRPLR